MKETPKEARIRSRMKPGKITLSGFLGKDKRTLSEIVAADEAELQQLNRSAEELADRMQYFTDASFATFEGKIVIDDIYEVETEVTRGKLPCPYAHTGLFRKTVTTLVNLNNNSRVCWTAMNIHLIKEHHFFEGKESAFRLEPADLVKALY